MPDIARQLPADFISNLSRYHSHEFIDRLAEALSTTPPTLAVRANTRRKVAIKASGDAVEWLAGNAIYLDRRPNFALDPAWHQGLYYVQDASSMVMTAVVKDILTRFFDGGAVRYLDACAAPGGKSIAAAEALPHGSILLSNEFDGRRASALTENMAKYGMTDIAVSNTDTPALRRLGEVFDIVAVDAPCSGEGMMRKEPVAIEQWSEGLVESCAALQRRILTDCWETLRPGGVMIYSTCTFNRTENEANLEFITDTLGGEPIVLPLLRYAGVKPGVDTDIPCYHFYPGFVRGEGLFIAAVRKPGVHLNHKAEGVKGIKAPEVRAFMERTVIDNDSLTLLQDTDGSYRAVPSAEGGFFAMLTKKLKLLSYGINIGVKKGKDFVPSWQLSFSERLCRHSFPGIDTDRATALRYLHGESLTDIPDGIDKGFMTVDYNGNPLGFAKNIGRRANNLYPDAMRLRLDPAKGIDKDYQAIV